MTRPVRERRTKTAEEALASLMRLCARAERSSGDAMRLMRQWGVDEMQRAAVLQRLVAARFIDDERYAEAFVREKLNLSGWGAYKIRQALQRKGIDRHTIDAALSSLDGEQMRDRLTERLSRKLRTVKYSSPYDLRSKLMRHALSLGYDFDTAGAAVAEVMNGMRVDDSETF
ncbi:MAG: RecX family transcriptional regulator [Alistipes sp.]|nr:RecX family transcriptional regulator [Alistipes sp.]MDE7129769.1 RecX family transcriptional regulator [Alistipes sp.]